MYTPGEFYHLYNRGVNRQPVFFCERNWGFFLQRLRKYFTPQRADVIAYCLMPNHYHLLVEVKCEDFSHTVMQPFSTSYTKAINEEQTRVGPLFQGRFKGKRVESNEVLMHLSRYIHLNPVKAGQVRQPEEWAYSSYRDYLGLRNGSLPKPAIILDQFACQEDYAAFVMAGLQEDPLLREYMLD